MLVDVTPETCDMKGAKRDDPCNCPVSRRIARVVQPEFKVRVTDTELKIKVFKLYNIITLCVVDLPETIESWITDYDHSKPGRAPKPIPMKLNIPKRFLRPEYATPIATKGGVA